MYTLERISYDRRGVIKCAPELLHRSKWEYFPEMRKYWILKNRQTIRCMLDGVVVFEVDNQGNILDSRKGEMQ